MAVTVIPNVTNWTVAPINGQAGYFTLMNTWLSQSTSVIASLQTAITAQNIANNEINELAIQVEDNATVATSLANYQGVWSSATTYSKGQSVSSGTLYYISKVDSNLNHIVTDTNYWLPNPINDKLDKDFSILTDKAIPTDNDIIVLREISGLLKKLSWANLKATLKTYFDTIYAPLSSTPVFSAYQTASNTSLTTNTTTKILLTTEEFDTDNQFDTTTSKFQPTIAGYYQIDTTVRFGAASFSGECSCQIFKNGVSYKVETKTPVSTAQKHFSSLSEVVYMNGTTDYLELYCVANGTSLVIVGDGQRGTRFGGFLIRRA